MEGSKASLEGMWKTLEALLSKMLSKRILTKMEHTQICNCVYAYCTHVNKADECQAADMELYSKLQQFFTNHVVSLAEKASALSDSDLLSLYEKHWMDYSLTAQHINNRCDYLNRSSINLRAAGITNSLYSLALTIWKNEYFLPFQEEIIKAILFEIEKERKGECISVHRLCTVIRSMVKLCAAPLPDSFENPYPQSRKHQFNNILSPNKEEPEIYLTLYRDQFEKAFMRETIRYYETESHSYLGKHTITDYLKWVEICVENERRRINFYLHNSSLNELINTTYDCLIRNHIEEIADEFRKHLDENRVEHLKLIQNLLFRYKEGEKRLVEMLESYVTEQGLTALQRVCPAVKLEPRVFVNTVIEVMEKIESFVDTALSNHPSISRAVARACERFVNHNAFTEAHGCTHSAPELIAKCADIILRNGPKEAQDVDVGIARVMKLFKFLEDKNTFQRFYTKFLARRLVYEQSISNGTERSMLLFLKDYCGSAYTTKLQVMLRDMDYSRSLKSIFCYWLATRRDEKNYQLDKFSVEFSATILNSNAWPYKAQTQLILPYKLEKYLSVFTEFYLSEHEKRKLSWCYHISRGELQTYYTTTNYTFTASTYQIAVLVLFNHRICYTVSQIKELTNMEENMLNRILDVLMKMQILKIASGNSSEMLQLRHQQQQLEGNSSADVYTTDSILTPDSCLTLNFNYNSKVIHVKLDAFMKHELKQETEKIFIDVKSDRKLAIQACIVRVMKARKRLDHQQLIREVMDQLSSRFNPTVFQIKECMAILIERDFIKRDPTNLCFYEYIALPDLPVA